MNRSRAVAFALALVLAPLTLLGEGLVSAAAIGFGDLGTPALLTRIAENDGLWLFGSLLALAGAVLLLPAVLAHLHLARAGAPRLTTAAALTLLPGVMGIAMHAVFWNVDHGAFAHADPRALAAAPDALDGYAGFIPVLVLIIVGFDLGLLLLAVALWRSRAVPRWSAALVGLWPLADVTVGGHVVYLLGSAAFTVAGAVAAVTLLRSVHGDGVEPLAQEVGAHDRGQVVAAQGADDRVVVGLVEVHE